MSKEIIINADKNQTRIALIEDGELAELHIESTDNERTLGDIYLGRVRRTMPSIQAAFIDIGQKQDAFLHYSDLADNLPDWLTLLEHENPNVSLMAPSSPPTDDEDEDAEQEKGSRQSRDAKSKKGDKIAADEEDSEESSKDGRNGSGSKSHQNSSRSGNSRSGNSRGGNSRRANTRGGKGRGSSGSNNSGNGSRPPESYLDKGKRILVKIVKEPISQKGSRVSTDISLAGRFLVLVPLANYVAVSKKIYSYKERRRLRALARSLLPVGFGVIVRTVAEGKKAKELDTDLRLLLDKWRKIEKRLEGSPEPPIVVHEDVSMASSVIRDLFSDDYDRILIDDSKLFKNVKSYVQAVAPHMVPAVQFHKGKRHIFKAAKIAHDVNQAFQSRVDLPSGGYLFIEHTEAMHVVDVNSGRAGRGLSQEQNSLKVDLEAVHAITKQIRLRDLGGIIVIDFIDLREERNRKKVYFELKKAFSKDRAVTKILPMSDFGLVEITRQRLRPSITKTFSNVDPGKKDAQEKKPVVKKEKAPRSMTIEGFVEKIERWITSYKSKGKSRYVMLQVHPFAAAFLMQKIPAYTTRWLLKYFIRVKLVIDDTLDPLGMRFINPKTGEPFNSRSDRRRGRARGRRKPATDKTSAKAAEARTTTGETTSKEQGGESSTEDSKSRRSRGNRTRGGRGRGNRSRNENTRAGKNDGDRPSSSKTASSQNTSSKTDTTSKRPESGKAPDNRSESKSDNKSGGKNESGADRRSSGRQDRSESRRSSNRGGRGSNRSKSDDRLRSDSGKGEDQGNTVKKESGAGGNERAKDSGRSSSRQSADSSRTGRQSSSSGETSKSDAARDKGGENTRKENPGRSPSSETRPSETRPSEARPSETGKAEVSKSAGSRSTDSRTKEAKTDDARPKSSGNETQIRRHSTTYRTTLNDATSGGNTRSSEAAKSGAGESRQQSSERGKSEGSESSRGNVSEKAGGDDAR